MSDNWLSSLLSSKFFSRKLSLNARPFTTSYYFTVPNHFSQSLEFIKPILDLIWFVEYLKYGVGMYVSSGIVYVHEILFKFE